MLTSQGYNLITDVSKWKATAGQEDAHVDDHQRSPLDYVLTRLKIPAL